jgi:hypothetical protein
MRSAPDNPNLFDNNLLQNAVSFAAAADAYAAVDKIGDWFPLYFLFGHSIELALKAFALSKGATEKDLMRIGHSLVKALSRAESDGLNVSALLTDAERSAIDQLRKNMLATRYPLLQ